MMNGKSRLWENQEEAASDTEQDLFTSYPISTLRSGPQSPPLGGGKRRELASYGLKLCLPTQTYT